MNHRLAAPLLALTLALGGCAASSEDAPSSASADVTASEAITLANYMTHPKIKTIRAQVEEIDAAPFKSTDNPGCDGSQTKFEDAHGTIRKLFSIGGEGGFEGRTTAYYNEAGGMSFVFHSEKWLEEEHGAFWKATETRVYYGPNNKVLFQAIREGQGAEPDQIDLSSAPDRLPVGEEAFEDGGSWLADPETWFQETGCPTEEPGHQ